MLLLSPLPPGLLRLLKYSGFFLYLFIYLFIFRSVTLLINNERMMLISPFPSFASSSSVVQCLEMTTKRKLIGRLVPCRCFRGEEEVISVLDYSHCSLQQVPKEIFSFERTLEELYLDANQIEELPKVMLKRLQAFIRDTGFSAACRREQQYIFLNGIRVEINTSFCQDDRKKMIFIVRPSFCWSCPGINGTTAELRF